LAVEGGIWPGKGSVALLLPSLAFDSDNNAGCAGHPLSFSLDLRFGR